MCLAKETCRLIAAEMAKQGITHEEMAVRLGLKPESRPYISNILSGKQTISMSRADEMVAVLGCRIRVKLERKK